MKDKLQEEGETFGPSPISLLLVVAFSIDIIDNSEKL